MDKYDDSSVIQLALKLHNTLAALDRQTSGKVGRVYGVVRTRLLNQIALLAEALGDPDTALPSDAVSLIGRADLLRQIEVGLTRAGVAAEPHLLTARKAAIDAAVTAAEKMISSQRSRASRSAARLFGWEKIDPAKINELIATLQDGTPLDRWLRKLGPETAAAVETAIERGVIEGVNVGELAKRLAAETGMADRRAMMAVRESTFGISRRANDETYRKNSKILAGKLRIEHIDEKTCRACLALHGRIYKVNEVMPGHPNCRRVEVPILKSGAGVQEVEQTGEAYLSQLSDDQLIRVFGSVDAVAAWKAGDVTLDDFHDVVETEWGPQTRIVGLNRALASAARRSG